MIAYLRLPDAAAWAAARVALAPGTQVDELGVIRWDDGTERPGWHVNVISDTLPESLWPHLVNPARPRRVYFGAAVLSMPEAMPEAGGAVMVERAVGLSVSDDIIARIERAVLRGRLTSEQAADRIALIQANLAVLDAREARAARLVERDAAVAELAAADAARAELISQRDAQVAVRDAAAAQLQTLTGAARLPVVATRELATAEIQRLTPLIQAATAARPALVAARDAAGAAFVAASEELAARRGVRDALRAA